MPLELESPLLSRGIVSFLEIHPDARELILAHAHEEERTLAGILEPFVLRRGKKRNLVFNYPREQYAKLDRGESPSAINASWLTLSADAYTNPAVETVTGELLRVHQTTQVIDPTNSKASIIRFILDVGQFVGTWPTFILIGGSATSTPGTGKIIAAVNSVEDDLGNPVVRTGSTLHLVNWSLKHLDSSEV